MAEPCKRWYDTNYEEITLLTILDEDEGQGQRSESSWKILDIRELFLCEVPEPMTEDRRTEHYMGFA